MIYTSLHRLDINSSQDIAHLIEHSIIGGFHNLLKNNDIDPSLIGWIDGSTKYSTIIIKAGFYDNKVYDLFTSYINKPIALNKLDLDQAIKSVEAEDKISIHIDNYQTFISRVNSELSGDLLKVELPSVTMTKNGRGFNDIVVSCYAPNDVLSEDEEMLFLRFSAIINDIFIHEMRSRFGAYVRGDSATQKDDDVIGFLAKYTLPSKQISNKELSHHLENILQNFDVDRNSTALKLLFDTFAAEPLWQSIVADYYFNTHIWTTNQRIAECATQENVKSLLSKLRVYVRRSTHYDDQYIG